MSATHYSSSPPSADSSQPAKPETEPSASGPVGGGEFPLRQYLRQAHEAALSAVALGESAARLHTQQTAARDAFLDVRAEGFRDCEELIAHMVEGMMTKPGLAREEIAILAGVALAIRVGQHRESRP